MQHTLFIADLHLDEKHKQSTDIFLAFMENQAPLADALYILGDFFEFWIGDDDNSSFHQTIKKSLRQLQKKNVPVYFLHGNRDFLIGKRFAREAGCTILPEGTHIPLYDSEVLLLHGDSLCSLDEKHMQFRKISLNKFYQFLFLRLPLFIRKKVGRKLRKFSKDYQRSLPNKNAGVVFDTVIETLKNHHATKMIHGHIHQPLFESFLSNNNYCERIVLGSWEQQGCALKWHASGKREMIFFK